MDESSLDLLIVGSKSGVVMIECGSNEVDEEIVIEAIKLAQETNNNNDEIDGSTGATTGFWNIGDSVVLKWSSVDRESWDFWRSLEFNNPAGPFGAPSQANSNVDGGLGVFSGTSSEYIYLKADPELDNQLSN